MKKVIIDEGKYSDIKEVHKYLSTELDFGPYYGNNLDALWDALTTNVERPFMIEWINADLLDSKLSKSYKEFIKILKAVEEDDLKKGWIDRFFLVIKNH